MFDFFRFGNNLFSPLAYGNIFRLQRTNGLSGTDATTVRANAYAGNTYNTAFPNWAHPLDYGLAPNTFEYVDFSLLSTNATYRFELYYTGETAARHTIAKTLLTPVIAAIYASRLQWVDLSTGTRAYLDPSNALAASTPSRNLAWTLNPYAETVRSAGVYTYNNCANVDQGLVGVVRGASSPPRNTSNVGELAKN